MRFIEATLSLLPQSENEDEIKIGPFAPLTTLLKNG
jgi:hypothetical protein